MEIIRKYKAEDGTEFSDQEKCLDHEDLIRRVDCIMKALPALPRDDGCDFANGHGFIQHDSTINYSARNLFLDLVADTISVPDQVIENGKVNHRGMIGRYIDDSGNRQLWSAWHRFMCTDVNFREWGQPYFAINPEKGDQICLNPGEGKP